MRKFELFFLMLLSGHSFSFNCYPQINPNLPQYIIGYGSLIDEISKKRTDDSAQESVPALIYGYERTWAGHGNLPGVNATFLTIFKNESSSFNGVVYRLNDPENVYKYDKREWIYCRTKLKSSSLKLLSRELPVLKEVWIYNVVSKVDQYPTKEYPIVQSYVDVFMRGCIQIEEKFKINNFAKLCIKSTEGWPDYWVNDRIFPRRPSLYEPYASRIDALLKETIPEKFKQIYFEKTIE